MTSFVVSRWGDVLSTYQNIDTLESVSCLLSLSLSPFRHEGVEIHPFPTPIDNLDIFSSLQVAQNPSLIPYTT